MLRAHLCCCSPNDLPNLPQVQEIEDRRQSLAATPSSPPSSGDWSSLGVRRVTAKGAIAIAATCPLSLPVTFLSAHYCPLSATNTGNHSLVLPPASVYALSNLATNRC